MSALNEICSSSFWKASMILVLTELSKSSSHSGLSTNRDARYANLFDPTEEIAAGNVHVFT